MILIPQRLFEAKQVKTILRDGNTCILKKKLTEPIVNREGYISNHVISILLSGEQHIRTYEDKLIKIKTGELVFIPRGMYYISDLIPKNGAFESLLFYFDDSIIQTFLSDTRVTKIDKKAVPDYLKFSNLPSINYFGESLINIYETQQLRNKAFLNLKILELLHLVNSLTTEQSFANFLFRLTLPKKRNIKAFMENNFDKSLKMEDYAYLTGRSLSTFRRDFKSYYDITPQKWLKTQRLTKAKNLIDSQEISVTQLAYEVGYENISYFIQAFKSRYGLSPKQYQLSQNRNLLK